MKENAQSNSCTSALAIEQGNLIRQDDRDNLEIDRLLIESHKLRAEASKFLAEASKFRRETFWYPYVVGSAALGAIGGIISLLTR